MRIASWLGTSLALVASLAAHADPRSFYVGAGVGESTVQDNNLQEGGEGSGPYGHPTGWKVFAGWRPIQVFGAELEYVDLGSTSSTTAFGVAYQSASARAVAAFAVGYLPLPIPFLDFYAKLGVAGLHANNVTTDFMGSVLTRDTQNAVLAYAVGMQVKFGAPAVRLEYQGFSTSFGDQTLLSLDVAWNF